MHNPNTTRTLFVCINTSFELQFRKLAILSVSQCFRQKAIKIIGINQTYPVGLRKALSIHSMLWDKIVKISGDFEG